MKINCCLITGASVLALASAAATGVSAHPIHYPQKFGAMRIDPNAPLHHAGPFEAPYVDRNPNTKSGTWTDVNNPPFKEGGLGPLLLTDGRVLIQDAFSNPSQWYTLTPDSTGQYTDGTWAKTAAMPSGYAPSFYAEQVLTDGRVLVEGGEYNQGNADWTNKGALYDPAANTWTSVSPPSGWTSIGDAESIILPNGSYMLANCCDSGPAEQASASISGTNVTWTTGHSYHYNDEQGYTLLPDGNVFMVDVWNIGTKYDDYEIYDTATGTWSLAGKTRDLLTTTKTRELGAAALTPLYGSQGTIIQFTGTGSPAKNDIYDVASSTWTSGPIMKVGTKKYYCADAPAATLPDGNVLVEASPSYGGTPAHFWEFSISSSGQVTATQVNDTKTSPRSSDFEGNMVLLPTGQVLWDDSQASTEISLYTPQGSANSSWLPVVSSVSSTLTVGSTGNAISGTNFNGFDLGSVYGDDAQAATNYPLVRITNNASGDVCFGKSYDFSTMGVWTTGTTNAVFDIPASCQTGASTLQVIVNGIASAGVSVTLNS